MRKPTLGERLNKLIGGPTIYLTLRTFVDFGQRGSTSRTGKGDPSIYFTLVHEKES
jgi:hypothetical protein